MLDDPCKSQSKGADTLSSLSLLVFSLIGSAPRGRDNQEQNLTAHGVCRFAIKV
jgi:hypothetical protein